MGLNKKPNQSHDLQLGCVLAHFSPFPPISHDFLYSLT
jgi:hypothetical protein